MRTYSFPYKKVLILENEHWNDNDSTQLHSLYKDLKKDPTIEFKIIDHAGGRDKNEIVESLLWCDVLLFASTFLYQSDVKGLGDLLMKIPITKNVIGYAMSNKSLQQHIEDTWGLKELAQMSHHKVFELVWFDEDLLEFSENPFKEIDLIQYKTQWDKEEEERIFKNHNMPKTGRKIRIGKIQASGPQWSLLKEGDVVDELDCSSIDERPSRGAWVMGKDEPVKLLNDSGYEEYQYDDLTAEGLTLEFFSRGSAKNRTDLMETLQLWIYKSVGCQLDDTELWEWCDNICNLVGVERRGNRHYFESRLKEYRQKHLYFREPGGDPREKKISAFKK